MERASIDEAYLDLTAAVNRIVAECPPPNQEDEPDPNALPNTRVVGWGSDEPESEYRHRNDLVTFCTLQFCFLTEIKVELKELRIGSGR